MKNVQAPAHVHQPWRDLVEAAIFETESENACRRIQDAQDAVMDEIEDTFQTACASERQTLINAMNALRELRRVSENSGSNSNEKIRKLTQAA